MFKPLTNSLVMTPKNETKIRSPSLILPQDEPLRERDDDKKSKTASTIQSISNAIEGPDKSDRVISQSSWKEMMVKYKLKQSASFKIQKQFDIIQDLHYQETNSTISETQESFQQSNMASFSSSNSNDVQQPNLSVTIRSEDSSLEIVFYQTYKSEFDEIYVLINQFDEVESQEGWLIEPSREIAGASEELQSKQEINEFMKNYFKIFLEMANQQQFKEGEKLFAIIKDQFREMMKKIEDYLKMKTFWNNNCRQMNEKSASMEHFIKKPSNCSPWDREQESSVNRVYWGQSQQGNISEGQVQDSQQSLQQLLFRLDNSELNYSAASPNQNHSSSFSSQQSSFNCFYEEMEQQQREIQQQQELDQGSTKLEESNSQNSSVISDIDHQSAWIPSDSLVYSLSLFDSLSVRIIYSLSESPPFNHARDPVVQQVEYDQSYALE